MPYPLPGDLLDPGNEPVSAASPEPASGFFTTESPGKPSGRPFLFCSCKSRLPVVCGTPTDTHVPVALARILKDGFALSFFPTSQLVS